MVALIHIKKKRNHFPCPPHPILRSHVPDAAAALIAQSHVVTAPDQSPVCNYKFCHGRNPIHSMSTYSTLHLSELKGTLVREIYNVFCDGS